MARETFIDTSGFYALLVKRDDTHEKAARVLASAAERRARHLDQGYSFTDCVNFATMKARGLRDALTKDEHFDKAGYVALLRSG
jgi:predicted nucleic acid-binding protein